MHMDQNSRPFGFEASSNHLCQHDLNNGFVTYLTAILHQDLVNRDELGVNPRIIQLLFTGRILTEFQEHLLEHGLLIFKRHRLEAEILVFTLFKPCSNLAIEYILIWLFCEHVFKNGPSPVSFTFIFGLFQTNFNTILQPINVKNVHPVYGAGIQTHDLQNMSLLP